jgi:SsrA-binding protein
MKTFATNKKAFFEYEILDKFEAGIVLTGNEVKSIRNAEIRLTGSYAIISDGKLCIINFHITKYKFTYGNKDTDELRTRVLLVHKKELLKLVGQVATKGITLVPLKIYSNNRGFIKLEIGVAKHKKLYDRKKELKEKDLAREAKRELIGKD